MRFQPGDRVRWTCDGDGGLPLVRYGFIGRIDDTVGRAVVMLDGDLRGNSVIDLSELQAVTITAIELRLRGSDLLDDPSLRRGLVSLWSAEADQAGLEVGDVSPLGAGVESSTGFTLAELQSGGSSYLLSATIEQAADIVWVRAERG